MPARYVCSVLTTFMLAGPAFGGLYFSGETLAELPSQWRGFLTDHRSLRLLAVSTPATGHVVLLREQYQEAARKLEDTARARILTADECADLGAAYVRLGRVNKAVELLRAAQRKHPEAFRVAANLGTAWQLQGELDQAAESLRESVRLAPPKLRAFEEQHLKLVRARQREKKGTTSLDDLF